MSQENQCPECGIATPANAPHGLCPGCLLKRGWEPSNRSCGDEGPASDDFAVPTSGDNAFDARDAAIDDGTVSPSGPMADAAGTMIGGRYKLLEKIGEGGMGTVFMAQQTIPVKRVVAVKIVKPGMDSKAVLARFEAERQALALMDHPNIARVLDAGSTESGRPFFVMELVKGIPITQYCDQRTLARAS